MDHLRVPSVSNHPEHFYCLPAGHPGIGKHAWSLRGACGSGSRLSLVRFFLVPPLYTFVISRWEEWIALFVFLVTALITSQLTTMTRQSVEQARLREREARILYETGRVINSTDRLDEQLDSVALALARVFFPWGVRECALLLPDGNGTLTIQADAPITHELRNEVKEVLIRALWLVESKLRIEPKKEELL
jgi:K+-sensing histidine kinase KdpD